MVTRDPYAVRFLPAAAMVVGMWSALTPQLRADVIQLRNGGELRGDIEVESIRDEDGPLRITLLSGTQIEVPRDDILVFARRSTKVEIFETRLKRSPQTVEALWELVQWCSRQRLPEERKECLQRLVEIDPNHRAARKMLGHVQYQGEWMPRDEMMRRKGYVKYEHRYVTRQELALLEKSQADRDAERAWVQRIRRYAGMLYSGDARQSQEARVALGKIDDPAAVYGLTTVFSNHADPVARQIMVDSLASIESPSIAAALTQQAMFDVDSAVRRYALTAIPKEYYAPAEQLFAYYLRNADNAIVRRAATALGEVGSEESFDDLINALVTQHATTVNVPVKTPTTFEIITPNTGVSVLDAPAPGPGSFVAGNGLPYSGRMPQAIPTNGVKIETVQVTVDVRNAEVLAALKSLTGKDFGYNERAWHLWLAAQKNHSHTLPNTAPPG